MDNDNTLYDDELTALLSLVVAQIAENQYDPEEGLALAHLANKLRRMIRVAPPAPPRPQAPAPTRLHHE